MRFVLAIGVMGALAFGCAPEPVAKAVEVQTSKLEKGTKIKAVLLKELTSGGTNEGAEVPTMVSEDVKDAAGKVLVPRGTPVAGKITWSRTEGTLGSLTNNPARLKFKFIGGKTADGKDFKLSAKSDADEEFELNRDNTGRNEASEQLEALASDKANDKALAA